MVNDLVPQGKTLKEKLDNIDQQVYINYGNKYGEAMAGVYIGQWYKGREINLLKGEGGLAGYWKIEQETGRNHDSLKKWHDLYKKYENLEDFKKEYVKAEVEKIMLKWEENQKKLSTSIETPELPEGKFSVFLADPAWEYRNTGVEGAVEKEYPTMSIEKLCNMAVKELTADNAVLFLWVTNPLLEECFPVIKSWGFEYKTNFVWYKKNKKTGNGLIWIPPFNDLGKILFLIGQCEDNKYPYGKGSELTKEFFEESILTGITYEEFCKNRNITEKY